MSNVRYRFGSVRVGQQQHVFAEHRGRTGTKLQIRCRLDGFRGSGDQERVIRRRERSVSRFRGPWIPAGQHKESVRQFGLSDVRGQVPCEIRVHHERCQGTREGKWGGTARFSCGHTEGAARSCLETIRT